MARLALLLTGFFVCFMMACTDSPVNAPSSDVQSPTTELPQEAAQMVALYGATDDGELGFSMAEAVRLGLEQYLTDTSYDVYAVTTVWGSFATGAPHNSTTIDWSGSMNVNGVGATGVVSVLSFEAGQDSLVASNDQMTIHWRSLTSQDIDGLVTFVAMKRGILYIQAPSFFFRTTPVAFELPVEQLAHFQAYYPTGNLAGVAIFARKLRPLICPRGQISGQWIRMDSTHMYGRFDAVWRSAENASGASTAVGKLEGTFWTGDAQNLLAGDWVDDTGTVTGQVKGTWMYTDYAMCPVCGTRFGVYEGEIFDLEGRSIGTVKGGFGEVTVSTAPPPQVLSMVGLFRFRCLSDNDPDVSSK